MVSIKRCCFFDLRTWTLILGVLSVVVSCCSCVYFVSMLANIDSRIEENNGNLATVLHCPDMDCVKWFRNNFVSTVVCELIVCCLHVIAGSVLIKAVLLMQPTSMTIYVIQTIFFIGLMSLIAIMNIVSHLERAVTVSKIVFPLVLSIVVDLGCLLVAHSYKKELTAQLRSGCVQVEAPPTVLNKGHLAWSY